MADKTIDFTRFGEIVTRIRDNVAKVIVGKTGPVDLMLVALIASGHVLIEDMPGTAKTLLAKTLARSLDLRFRRIQFTPDLLPGDLTGISYYNQKSGDFIFRQGPVFTDILLADEINRATPRTQSSLLECMEERQVTVENETMQLQRPFLVIATQNPIETHGTFPLPEAQLDRFLIKMRMGYPDRADGMEIMRRFIGRDPFAEITPTAGRDDVIFLQDSYAAVHVSDAILEYILRIVERSRSMDTVDTGLSPRSSQALVRASQASAAMKGRAFVLPDDVRELAVPVLAHRLSLAYAAQLEKNKDEAVIREILETVTVPAEKINVSIAIGLAVLAVLIVWLLADRILLKKYGLRGVVYSREFGDPYLFEGEETVVVERIENRKLLPVPLLLIESAVDESMEFASQKNLLIRHGFYHTSSFFLPPWIRIRRRHKVRLTRRGCYYLTEAALNCCTFYGLIADTRIAKFSTRIVVYPKLIPLTDIPFPSRSWQGETVVRRWIVDDPIRIAGARPYRDGDPMSRINWKATARSGSLHSHNTEYTASPKIMICLCFDINDEMWDRVTEPYRIEKGISCAASVAVQMIAKGVQAGLLCNGRTADGVETRPFIYMEPKSGETQSRQILEMLATLTMVRSYSFHALLQNFIKRKDFDAAILVITPHAGERLKKQLGYYKAHGGAADIIEI